MEDLSLHLLDIAENSIDASANRVDIKIIADRASDRLILEVADNGKGMDKETIKKVKDPFFTTKTVRGFGLGIPLLAQAAEECNGIFTIESASGKGTKIKAEFQMSHIDRRPLGDMGSTITTLIAGHPEIDFSLTLERNGTVYIFDTAELKKELEGVPINLPNVLKLIKEDINDALPEV